MKQRARLVTFRPSFPYLLSIVVAFLACLALLLTAQPADAHRFGYGRGIPTAEGRNHPPTPHSEVMRAIEVATAEFGVSHSRALAIAKCESGHNPFNSNGTHDGLFAQSRKYWASRVAAFNAAVPHNPVSGTVWNAFDNARVSARMMKLRPSLADWEQCL